jgi:hypothetical protein
MIKPIQELEKRDWESGKPDSVTLLLRERNHSSRDLITKILKRDLKSYR